LFTVSGDALSLLAAAKSVRRWAKQPLGIMEPQQKMKMLKRGNPAGRELKYLST
jgi:hypothetical protein